MGGLRGVIVPRLGDMLWSGDDSVSSNGHRDPSDYAENQQRQWQVVNETLGATPFQSFQLVPQGI